MTTPYLPAPTRYEPADKYRCCGRSGLKLLPLSLGLWHNFADTEPHSASRDLVLYAFDRGITHFDLANNYGPPPGSAEQTFGRILREDLAAYRDELIVSTKAGYLMWPGPYGDGGSRKYLLASLDQSLRRLGLEYVDIFYSHRFDPHTPLEETMGALAHAVRSGKALYVGLSNYPVEHAAPALALLRQLGVPALVHQPRYHMFDRTVEHGLLELLAREGVGCVSFGPLGQGVLTNRYLDGIPTDARAARDPRFLKPESITPQKLAQVRALHGLAQARGQSLAQMALAWVLRQPAITSALLGASKRSQLDDNLGALRSAPFSADELATIDRILAA
jgi:L-glyceraldehyde 3-phosphate reductase